jgi:hypothetical protein
MTLRGKRAFILGLLAGVILVTGFALPVLAAGSQICVTGSACTQDEVGVFMKEISKTCGNEGTCSVADIMQVFINVGNFVLSIVGAAVFFMYVVGGFQYLLSAGPGQSKRMQAGKDAIKIATVGLLIVFAANVGMRTIKNMLLGNNQFYADEGEVYVTCAPGTTESPSPSKGEACGFNQVCDEDGACITECKNKFGSLSSVYQGEYGAMSKVWQCVDITSTFVPTGGSFGGCKKDLCPGDENTQCCEVLVNP